MRENFPTREKLETMTRAQIGGLDIQEKDEEELVQDVLNNRREVEPLPHDVYRKDIIGKDIQTKEQELEYQRIIDEREAKLRGINLTPEVPKVEIPEIELKEEEVVSESEKPFCEFCDSKGVRHKKDCPTRKK